MPFNARTVVGTSVHDGFRDGLLSPSRVNGDDRAAKIDQLEKFGNRRALSIGEQGIRFLVRRHLPETQTEVARLLGIQPASQQDFFNQLVQLVDAAGDFGLQLWVGLVLRGLHEFQPHLDTGKG